MISFLLFQFLANFSYILSLASWLSLVLVAYWVYENDKKIEFMEEHVWKKLDKTEAELKISRRQIEELQERLKEFEAKTS